MLVGPFGARGAICFFCARGGTIWILGAFYASYRGGDAVAIFGLAYIGAIGQCVRVIGYARGVSSCAIAIGDDDARN